MQKLFIILFTLFFVNNLFGADRSLKGLYDSSSLWNKKEISVCWEVGAVWQNTFDDELVITADYKELVQKAIEETWAVHTGLNFTGWGACNDKDSFDIRIDLDDEEKPGFPRVNVAKDFKDNGKNSLGNHLQNKKPALFLNFTFTNFRQDTCKETKEEKEICIYNGAVHEFGHLLGLSHEQNRGDNWEIDENGDHPYCNRQVQEFGDFVSFGSFNEESIMSYCNNDRADYYHKKKFPPSKGDIEVIKSMYSSFVGVIPNKAGDCPNDSEELTIYMDDENSDNRNKSSGWNGAIESTKNTKFRFCRVNGSIFKPVSNGEPYAVLKLSDQCPVGSREFKRRFDNNDYKNKNYSKGDIAPNVVNRNTYLRFCVFGEADSDEETMQSFPNFKNKSGNIFSYGVFARSGFSYGKRDGYIYTDDEDSRNINKNYYYGTSSEKSQTKSDKKGIVDGGRNTTINLRQIKSISLPITEESSLVKEDIKDIIDDEFDGENYLQYISVTQVTETNSTKE